MRAFLTAFASMLLLVGTAQAKPIDCHETESRWWQRQLDKFINTGGQYGVNPAMSLPEVGLAHVTWDDGSSELVRVGQVGDQFCVVERNAL